MKVRLLLSHKDLETGILSLLMITFQREYNQVLEKDISGCRIFISQRVRERIYNPNFSKGNTLRKGRSGAFIQEETCLKFS